MDERSESKPLLVNLDNFTEVKLYFPKWLGFIFLCFVPFLHMMSYMLSLYVIGQYTYVYFLEEKYPGAPHSLSGSLATCNVNTTSIEYIVQTEIQKTTAEWGIYTNLAFIIPAVLININLATYSDVYGRKLFFIVPIVGSLLKNIFCGIGMYYNLNVRIMLIFYMIEACTGTWICSLAMSFCYVADTTKPGIGRSLRIAILEGGVGFGIVVASLISGYSITGTNGYYYPQMIAAGLAFVAFIIAVVMIDETLHETKKRKSVSILHNMKRVFECYKPGFSPHGKQWIFITLILLFTMSVVSNLSRANVDYLYQIAAPFCWDTVTIGIYGAVRTCCLNIGGIIMIPLFHLFASDEVTAIAGCVTSVVSMVIQGLAQTSQMLYISAVASVGCGVTMPMVRSIMSQMTPFDKQGSVFAGIAAVESFFSLVGTIVIGILYESTVDIYRGLTFLIWTVFGVVGVILGLIIIIGKRRSNLSLVQKEIVVIAEE